jgi:hypothetical protein
MSHPIALLATHIRAQAVKIKRPAGTAPWEMVQKAQKAISL